MKIVSIRGQKVQINNRKQIIFRTGDPNRMSQENGQIRFGEKFSFLLYRDVRRFQRNIKLPSAVERLNGERSRNDVGTRS